MEFKLGADFNNGFENTEPENIKIALLQDGQSIINNEPCCDTCKCEPTKEEKFNKLMENQTSFEE